MNKIQKKYHCPSCGYDTMSEEPPGTFEICSICFWEDDNVQFNDIYYFGGANKISLVEGQKNFEEFGASKRDMIEYVRKPNNNDSRAINCKKLS